MPRVTTEVRKFGYNPSVALNGDEDIWSYATTLNYAWPAAAAATFIVSSATNDRAGGTGAIVVEVFGVDQKMAPLSETVTLTSTTSVSLANNYFRVFRAYVHECGSAGTNVGNVHIKQGAAVVAEIPAGYGQTEMAIYTVPFFGPRQTATLRSWHAAISKRTATTGEIQLVTRLPNHGWRVRDVLGVHTDGASLIESQDMGVDLPPGTDVRLHVSACSAGDTSIYGGFHIELEYDG